MLLDVQITGEPYDKVIHGYEELDLTGLKLSIAETDGNGNVVSTLENVTVDEAKEKYDVSVDIKEEAPGSGICVITITKKNTDISDTESFEIGYGAPVVRGDVNSDGEFNISDVVLLQKWLLAMPDTQLSDWNRADLCRDGRLDTSDLCLMKQLLISGDQEIQSEKSIISGIRNGMTKDEVFAVLGKEYTDEEEELTQRYAYYYPVKSGDVFGTELEGEMFVEFDLKTGLLVNYGYALGRVGTKDNKIYPYTEQQLKEAYDKIYSVMTDWYGEGPKGSLSGPKAEYTWETDNGQVWAVYGVNLWSANEPETYEKGINELILSCSVESEKE